MKEKRVFLAIPLPSEITAAIASFRDKLGLELKWIPESNLHITLIFLGNISEDRISEVSHLLKQMKSQESFELQVEGFTIKSTRHHHMIWATFKKSLEFESLVYACHQKLHLKVERDPLPHINLARSKSKISTEKFPFIFDKPLSWEVKAIDLYESILSPAGARYILLENIPLKEVK